MINGIRCHETGCPEAWRDERRECPECGTEFVPEERFQRWCDEDCGCPFLGIGGDHAAFDARGFAL